MPTRITTALVLACSLLLSLSHALNVVNCRRRAFLLGGPLLPLVVASSATAIPLVSTDEFNSILRDSASSITQVEFSGPKSETVTVQLVDGTQFGIRDVVESSTDPRSPLKIAANLKANQIPVRFTSIEAALGAGRTKKKNYANNRVLEAAEKEKEKARRMQQDEELRQAELERMKEL